MEQHDKAWLTPQEFAKAVSVNTASVRRWCACGRLKARNFGTKERAVWRIPITELTREHDEVPEGNSRIIPAPRRNHFA